MAFFERLARDAELITSTRLSGMRAGGKRRFIVTVNTAPGHFDRKQYQTVRVATPGEFLNLAEMGRLVKKLIRGRSDPGA